MRTCQELKGIAIFSSGGWAFWKLLALLGMVGGIGWLTVPVLTPATRCYNWGTCLANARQVMSAVKGFVSNHHGKLPSNCGQLELWSLTKSKAYGSAGVYQCPYDDRVKQLETQSNQGTQAKNLARDTACSSSYQLNPLFAGLDLKLTDIPNPNSTAVILERAEFHLASERTKHSITVAFASGNSRLIPYPQRFEAMNPFLPEGRTKN